MIAAPLPTDEPARMHALQALEILDTGFEPEYDALARLAARLAECPVAMITLIDADRQWFKASHGISARQSPRSISFCAHTILHDAPMVVSDLRLDPRFAGNPMVGEPFNMRFYAGHPISHAGCRLGTICVADRQPRTFSAAQLADLTELSRVASALLDSRADRLRLGQRDQLLAKLSRQVPGVIYQFRMDADGSSRFPFASDAIRTIYALAPEDVQDDAQPVFDRLHPEDLGRVIRSSLRSRETLQDWHEEYRVQLPGQPVQWRDGHATPERTADGATIWHGYISDSTQRKLSEQALRQSRHEAQLACATAQVGIASWELGGLPAHIDALCRAVYGFDPSLDRVSIDQWLDTLLPEDRAQAEATVRSAMQSGEPCELNLRIRRGDGAIRHVEFQMRQFADEVSGQRRMIAASRDVTERVEAARLQLAARTAEQANAAKTQFLARVSHELRTPLNAILGFAHLLGNQPALRDDRHSREQLTHIDHAGQHLLALINDLLELTRTEQGGGHFEPAPVELARLADQSLALMQATARLARVTLTRDPLDGPLPAMADGRRLQQCLINLLSNAIKYNHEHGQVRLELARHGDGVAIHVHDTGLGLTAQQIRDLFQPFNRVGAERTMISGSGLGLAITKTLVERMNGQLTVRSTPGTGSVFSILLPAGVTGPAASQADPAAGSDSAPLRQACGANRTVLYIEDNSLNRALMEAIFASRPGVHLMLADDGAHGQAVLGTVRPDLILLDMHLPDCTGGELLHSLRGNPATACIPVIAVSADAMPEDIDAARRAGFLDYWIKPLNIEMIHQALDRLLATSA